ncbi:Exonuclease V [Acropora cervicornis]|uniref:Exonuclease V n=1 Tax=Acropora cervicornis TaxID=6130 RepID=A0AAD9VH61_ACRCE|nr:Exonuclease V [Acropora cervicornis]
MADSQKVYDICHDGENSIEVEIVSDLEFNMLDNAIQAAILQESNAASSKETDNAAKGAVSANIPAPFDRFRGEKGYLSVSNLVAQFWCEQQMEYNFLIPEQKPNTEEVQIGRGIHLAREMELYDLMEIKIETKEDKWAAIFMDCLTKMALLDAHQTVREFPVLGEPFDLGVFVHGIIDELHFNEIGQLELVELKTRSGIGRLPSKAQQKRTFLQTMLYSVMFNNLLSGKLDVASVFTRLQLNGDAILSKDIKNLADQHRIQCDTLFQVTDLALRRFQSSNTPQISTIVVEYFSQVKNKVINRLIMDLDEDWTKSKLNTMLSYWTGKRETIGVEIEEAWKCQRCEFADICEWRMKKDEECRRCGDNTK